MKLDDNPVFLGVQISYKLAKTTQKATERLDKMEKVVKRIPTCPYVNARPRLLESSSSFGYLRMT